MWMTPGLPGAVMATVFLNGQPLRDCIFADEEAGRVIVLHDDHATRRYQLDENSPDGAAHYELFGTVEIRFGTLESRADAEQWHQGHPDAKPSAIYAYVTPQP